MIIGQRVRLRAIERADLPRFVDWFADPEVRDGLGLHLGLSLAQEKQVGFKHEGRLRRDRFHDGRYNDTLIMAILREEWEAGKA